MTLDQKAKELGATIRANAGMNIQPSASKDGGSNSTASIDLSASTAGTQDEADFDFEYYDEEEFELDLSDDDSVDITDTEGDESVRDLNSIADIRAFKVYMMQRGVEIGDANEAFAQYPALYDLLDEFMASDNDMIKAGAELQNIDTNSNSKSSAYSIPDSNAFKENKKLDTAAKVFDASAGGPIGFLFAADTTGLTADIGYNVAKGAAFVSKQLSTYDIPSKVAVLYAIKRLIFHVEGLALNQSEDSICGFRNKFYPTEYKAIMAIRAKYADVLNERSNIRKSKPSAEYEPQSYSSRYVEMYNEIAQAVHNTVIKGIAPYIVASKLPYYLKPYEMNLLFTVVSVWFLAPANLATYIENNGRLSIAVGFGSGNQSTTDNIRMSLISHHEKYLKSLKSYSSYQKAWTDRLNLLRA